MFDSLNYCNQPISFVKVLVKYSLMKIPLPSCGLVAGGVGDYTGCGLTLRIGKGLKLVPVSILL